MIITNAIKLLSKYFLTAKPANGPEKQEDFAMHLESINLENYHKELLSFADIVETRVAATVAYENKTYPIYQLTYSGKQGKHKLLIIGGVHGNEVAGVLAVRNILEDIRQHPDVYADWNVTILSPANPVGLAYQSRYNGQGYDINRDFKNFETIEAQLQRDTVVNLKPDIIVSLHEGPHEGFFFIPMKSVPSTLVSKIRGSLLAQNILLSTKSFIRLPLTHSGVMVDSLLIRTAKQLFGIHTFGTFADRLGIPTITTESPWGNPDIAVRTKAHIETVRAVVGNFSR